MQRKASLFSTVTLVLSVCTNEYPKCVREAKKQKHSHPHSTKRETFLTSSQQRSSYEGGERQTETNKQAETDRGRQRQTSRQRQTEADIQRQADSQTDRQTERGWGKLTCLQSFSPRVGQLHH